MTRDDQKRFVQVLCRGIEARVLRDIDEGRIPLQWDGIELREMLARMFAEASYIWKRQPRARRKAFENHLLVTNL
jgi:hypothetical protein